jgi:tyrosinase
MEHLNLSPSQMDRRVFIKGVGWITVGLLAGLTFGGCEGCQDKIKNRPMRRRLRTGSPEVDAAINTYSNAVKKMKDLVNTNPSDKRSWANQAGIHGTVSGGFNLCQHGTDHFFSWHRAYLVWFERICQELTGDKNFGLPYWNWNQNPDIHPTFLNNASPLFEPRFRTSMTGNSATSTSALDPIFVDTNFFTFSSQIEGTPHNTVHGWIGGGNVLGGGGSALDPLFWMHHCMVDYCWAKWNLEMGNDNTDDATWNGTNWNHFFDAQGNSVDTTAGATVLMPLFSYQYESSAIGSNPEKSALSKTDFQKAEKRIRKGAKIKFEITQRISLVDTAVLTLATPFNTTTREPVSSFTRIIHNDKSKEMVFASVEFASLPPIGDFFVRVFINLPRADRNTPITDPHYAGSFAFFGTDTGHQMHAHQPNFLVNLSPTIAALQKSGELRDDSLINIQLVAVPNGEQFIKQDATLALKKVELIVTPVILHSESK